MFRVRMAGIFSDRIYRIYKILISHFQFPEETENTQSPSANDNILIST
jgi:hypothetical protein